jgi:hypothetical protein
MLQGAANFGIGTLALDRTCGISTLFEEETMKFAPGQIAKSGGQPVTVVAVDEETVECIWLGDGGELREPIPTLALERAYGSDDAESDTDDETDVARAASGGDEEEDDDEDDDDDEEDEDDEEDDDEDDEDDEDEEEEASGEEQEEREDESDESGAPRRRKRAVSA